MHDGEKEVISMDMGLMVGDISIPLIFGSHQLEGIRRKPQWVWGFSTSLLLNCKSWICSGVWVCTLG
jgi:hypothetical protein